MFSGLTNQVSNWMGSTAKKQEVDTENADNVQTLTSPVENENSVGGAEADKKDVSPTKGVSRLDMLGNLGNVKTQMTSWLGSVPGSIPSFRKTDGIEVVENLTQSVESPASEKSVKGSSAEKDEEDNSSATGGADSDAGEMEETDQLDDKDSQAYTGGVSTKAIQGVKNVGSFLFSAVNTAGKKVTETTAKIKKTVEENSLLGEFNKEQEAFIKEKQAKAGETAVPPWVGYSNQDSLKEECLALSQDKRNFVRSPPAGVDFTFDYETSYPVAMATLAEDPNLETMRFELVPKVISEENFWQNYFYRVSLICQACELNLMAQEGNSLESRTNTEPTALAPPKNSEDSSFNASRDSTSHEFVSDSFRPSSQDLEEVREGMKKLGLETISVKEEEWEKELEEELQDFEVVSDGEKKGIDVQWENQLEEMLGSENLK